MICRMNRCSELTSALLSAPPALGFHPPSPQARQLLAPGSWLLMTCWGGSLIGPVTGRGQGRGYRTLTSQPGSWTPPFQPSWGLAASCPRARAASVYQPTSSTLQLASPPAPTYHGDWSLGFWHHPGFFLFFSSPSCKLLFHAFLPRRMLLLAC